MSSAGSAPSASARIRWPVSRCWRTSASRSRQTRSSSGRSGSSVSEPARPYAAMAVARSLVPPDITVALTSSPEMPYSRGVLPMQDLPSRQVGEDALDVGGDLLGGDAVFVGETTGGFGDRGGRRQQFPQRCAGTAQAHDLTLAR